MDNPGVTYEVCPHCGEEVELVAFLGVQSCPHCGKRIVNGVLVLKVCPKCKHSLVTGKKV